MTDTIKSPHPSTPSGVSDAARAWLANERVHMTFPEAADTAAWEELAAGMNQHLASSLAGLELPVRVDEREAGPFRIYVVDGPESQGADRQPVYLEIHGGALLAGSGEACALMGGATAMATGLTTWAVDYRMPPHHPYPAALDDCVLAYRLLLRETPPEKIFVGGTSAGGNLATALLVRARDEGLPMPRAVVLRTPEIDLTESGDSFVTNDRFDNLLGSLMPINLLYADGHDLADPYLSPLFADLSALPPAFLQSGTRDLYLSNTVRLHRRLLHFGVAAELHVWEAMPHAGFGGASPEDLEVVLAVRDFISRHRA